MLGNAPEKPKNPPPSQPNGLSLLQTDQLSGTGKRDGAATNGAVSCSRGLRSVPANTCSRRISNSPGKCWSTAGNDRSRDESHSLV